MRNHMRFIVAAVAALVLVVMRPAMGQTPAVTAVVNGASFTNQLAPGTLAEVFGRDFATQTVLCERTAEGRSPTTCGGVSVAIAAASRTDPAALLFVSPQQISLQLPVELAPGPVTLQVERTAGQQTVRSAPFSLTLDTYAPGLFTVNIQGTELGLFVNFVGNNITANRPAKPGDEIGAFGVGLGPTDPVVPTGAMSQAIAPTVTLPRVTVAGQDAEVSFSGLNPSSVGLYQVNFRVPPNTPVGDQPVILEIGGKKSNTVSLPVAAPSVTISSVVSSGSGTQGISSGSWIEIYGTALSSTTRIWKDSDFANNKLPTSLDGVSVKVNGKDAAVYLHKSYTDQRAGAVRHGCGFGACRSEELHRNSERYG